LIELAHARAHYLACENAVMFCGNEAWIDLQAPRFEFEIVIAAAEFESAHFNHLQEPSFRTEVLRAHLERHHTMRDTVEM
jgi:hypothetical protein